MIKKKYLGIRKRGRVSKIKLDKVVPDQMYSLKEAAKLLGVSYYTIWREVKQKKIASVKLGKEILVAGEAIIKFLRPPMNIIYNPNEISREEIEKMIVKFAREQASKTGAKATFSKTSNFEMKVDITKA